MWICRCGKKFTNLLFLQHHIKRMHPEANKKLLLKQATMVDSYGHITN